MNDHKWHYKTIRELKQELDGLGLYLPFSEDLSALSKPLEIGGRTIPNRIVYQPMEGADSHTDGSPGEGTVERYKNFARGGPGIIWVEAVPVLPEARGNPRQLYLHEENLPHFTKFVDDMRTECFRENNREVFIVIQFTHSGRYSRPQGTPAPVIAFHNPQIEETHPAPDNAVISDEGLKRYEEAMGKSAALAQKAGFDGAEVKCCHGYLASEFLSARERFGLYGGCFENRARLFLNCIESARANTTSAFTITSRLNIYDGLPHPWGFGASEDGLPDLEEPLRLIEILNKGKMKLLNLTMGISCRFHLIAPRDNAPEHPLAAVSRMQALAKKIKDANKDMAIVTSMYSYLRQFSPMCAAGSIAEGISDMAGYGRLTFAYPDAARDILSGKFDENKICLCCPQCGYPCRIRGREKP
ncbi:MAG: flavin oxidoreductase/NADH oxidase [Oscillospiraceae bacterium]|nr:flavin oxidoreductase/NADH oxidase [Oscillospiraceae bacterium]